jgi:uroporphyrin-III C-methyltransferase
VKITLIGAGIGDPDLITVKGMKALQTADVVLYDALANDALLQHTREECKHIYVGKRAKNHTFEQDEINDMMVQYAREYGHVVRLKGGDPYVFGRGHEEAEYARAQGIEVEVIPGITSAVAAPSVVGIPVTRRGLSESFWVITAATSDGDLTNDIYQAAKTDATIVILMGIGKLNEIVAVFKKENKGDMPVAVIQDASLPSQKVAVSTIDNIVQVVENQGIKSPSVIVIGKVASLSRY